MKYLFTVLAIIISWLVIIIIMPIVNDDKHFLLYSLAMINTFVLYLIGFRNK